MRQLFGFFGVLLTALAVLAANLDEPTGFRVNPTASMGPAIAAALCFVSEATLATAQIRTGLHREPEPPRRYVTCGAIALLAAVILVFQPWKAGPGIDAAIFALAVIGSACWLGAALVEGARLGLQRSN